MRLDVRGHRAKNFKWKIDRRLVRVPCSPSKTKSKKLSIVCCANRKNWNMINKWPTIGERWQRKSIKSSSTFSFSWQWYRPWVSWSSRHSFERMCNRSVTYGMEHADLKTQDWQAAVCVFCLRNKDKRYFLRFDRRRTIDRVRRFPRGTEAMICEGRQSSTLLCWSAVANDLENDCSQWFERCVERRIKSSARDDIDK